MILLDFTFLYGQNGWLLFQTRCSGLGVHPAREQVALGGRSLRIGTCSFVLRHSLLELNAILDARTSHLLCAWLAEHARLLELQTALEVGREWSLQWDLRARHRPLII